MECGILLFIKILSAFSKIRVLGDKRDLQISIYCSDKMAPSFI